MHHNREMVVFIFPVPAENIFEGLKNPFCFGKCNPDNNKF